MRPRSLARILPLAAAFLLGGCDGTNLPGSTPGTVRFSYSGAHAGTYDATGAEGIDGDWATAWQMPGDLIAVQATARQDDGPSTVVGLSFRAAAGGSVLPIDPGACAQDDRCTQGLVAFDVYASPMSQGKRFTFTEGSIRIESRTGGRIRGTFSGHAVDGAGEAMDVVDGTFDVPLRQAR
jgi:hypothetical protein